MTQVYTTYIENKPEFENIYLFLEFQYQGHTVA